MLKKCVGFLAAGGARMRISWYPYSLTRTFLLYILKGYLIQGDGVDVLRFLRGDIFRKVWQQQPQT